MKTKDKQLKIGAVISYISIILNVITGLVYTPWMVKTIGQAQYGLYTLAYSLISLFLVDFGLSSATVRFVSKYHSEGNEQRVNDFLGVVYKLYLAIDALVFILLITVYFFIDHIYVNITPQELAQFKVVYIIAGVFSIINFPFVTLNGILTAYEEFVPLKLADVFYRVVLVGIMVIALLLGKGLYTLVAINAIVGLLIVAYKLIVCRIKTPIRVNFRYRDRILYKELFSFSSWSMVSTLSQRLVFSITPSILGIVYNSGAIAVFGIISTIEGYVFTFTTAINGMFMPKISRAYAGNNAENELFPLFLNVGRLQYLLNGLIIAGFAVVGKQFINLWMGIDYGVAYIGILLVIIPGLFYNSLQIANTALLVINKVKYIAYVNIATGLINVVLSFVLSKHYGVLGACISICIAFTIRNVLISIIHYKVLKLDIPRFINNCYIRMSIPIFISIVFGLFVNSVVIPSGLIDLFIRSAAVCLVFALSMYIFSLSKHDKEVLIQYLRMIKRGRKNDAAHKTID